jgi:hypothetical protein
MMPQLGVLSTIHPKAAKDVFHKDCLIHLGTSLSPKGLTKPGNDVGAYNIETETGEKYKGVLKFGEIIMFPLGVFKKAKLNFEPTRSFDVGHGHGKNLETGIDGGVVGIILDGRGRPLQIPTDNAARIEALTKWLTALNIYPPEALRAR